MPCNLVDSYQITRVMSQKMSLLIHLMFHVNNSGIPCSDFNSVTAEHIKAVHPHRFAVDDER
jgi:hypothetical protein